MSNCLRVYSLISINWQPSGNQAGHLAEAFMCAGDERKKEREREREREKERGIYIHMYT